MPFFVRQKVRSVKVGIYVVEAQDQKAAETLHLGEDNYIGYYTDDSKFTVGESDHREIEGPFSTQSDAENSEAGWIEDI